MTKKRINLLPPEEQKENHLRVTRLLIIRLGVLGIGSILVLTLILFSARLFLTTTLRQTEADIVANNKTLAGFAGAGLENEIATLNETITNFGSLEGAQKKWSPYLMELARLMPADVSLDSIVINRTSRKVELAGKAANRDSVLELRQNILSSAYFENINFPLYNLVTARNVAWKYRFYLKNNAE